MIDRKAITQGFHNEYRGPTCRTNAGKTIQVAIARQSGAMPIMIMLAR